MKRWLLLENEPTLRRPDWLPPADAWPELAHLRAEHERLLALVGDEQDAATETRRRFETEDKGRSEALKRAFQEGGELDETAATPPDVREAAVREAQQRTEAAHDALVEFLNAALAEIRERAPEWYAAIEQRKAEAEVTRAEARQLLAEADRHVATYERMRFWLDRETGKSALGHFPFEQLELPVRPPDPDWSQIRGAGMVSHA